MSEPDVARLRELCDEQLVDSQTLRAAFSMALDKYMQALDRIAALEEAVRAARTQFILLRDIAALDVDQTQKVADKLAEVLGDG